MPVKPLPPNPNLDHLKHQAKDLLKAHASGDPQAAQRIREFHPLFQRAADPAIFNAPLRLADAQLTIAREHGFASWARLKRHIEKPTQADKLSLPHHERIEDRAFRQAVDLLDQGDVENLRAHLKAHPKLVDQRVLFEGGNYFRNPTLLEFVAENPIRRDTLPPNIVDVAKVILEAGASQSSLNNAPALDEALALVSSGCVPRKCGVQIPLIDLLCRYGADPNFAMSAALPHGEFEAVNALLRNGARVDLFVAAGLGRTEDARRLLDAASPSANDDDRYRALAIASQLGHVEIVRLLLDAGVDPDRYNPVGLHAHSTPLHQAAFGGHLEVVRVLVERGARLDLKDTIWQGTPLGWAIHGGKSEIAEYLRAQERAR